MEKVMPQLKLFQKVLAVVVLVFVAVFAYVSIYSSDQLYRSLLAEYTSKGSAIVDSIVDASADLLLNKDAATIQSLLDQYRKIDGVAYVMVRNSSGEIVSHTFVPGVPPELDQIQKKIISKGHFKEAILTKVELPEWGEVIDITAPILLGEIGEVHVGMETASIRRTISEIIWQTQLILGLVFLIGIFLLFFLIRRISRPLQVLTAYAESLALHDFSSPVAIQEKIKRLTGRRRDEISQLAGAFIHLEDEIHSYVHRLKVSVAENERIQSELKIASEIQMSMIPTLTDIPAEIDVAAVMQPAREVGGDFYDLFRQGDKYLYVCVGDVSGKGVSAALFMAASITMIRAVGQSGSSPAEVLRMANSYLCERNDKGLFVTVFLGCLNLETGEFVYANAGHPSPYILNQAGGIQALDMTDGLVVGIEPEFVYLEKSVWLNQYDKLVLFSDGVSEAEDPDGNFFEEAGIETALTGLRGNASEVQQALFSTIEKFVNGAAQSDDLTLMTVEWKKEVLAINQELSVFFENDIQEIAKLHMVIAQFSKANQISEMVQMNMNVALEELLSNTIFYGYDDHESHKIYAYLSIFGDIFEARLEDDGIPFNPLESKEVDLDAALEDKPIGGLGIHFVKAFTHFLGYERRDNKNIVTIQIKTTEVED